MRILIIEDDATCAEALELMLRSEGFNAVVTGEGEDGTDLAKLYGYDAITLDLTLPDMTGFDVIRQIRTAKIRTPILVLCSMAQIEDKVKALGLGADDYMTKPFHKDELVARLHAIVRRANGHAVNKIVVGDLTVNLDTKQVSIGEKWINLTGKEYAMLELLALHKGHVVSRDQFLSELYGGMDEPEIKIIDVFICKLRKKIGAGVIETIWGRGFKLVDGETSSPSMAPEVADLADNPPTGYVSELTFNQRKRAKPVHVPRPQKEAKQAANNRRAQAEAAAAVHIRIPAT